ncbi:DEAD/DEAH box helicase family protein, partial [Vibrio parahaemolyticus V-223/04]
KLVTRSSCMRISMRTRKSCL